MKRFLYYTVFCCVAFALGSCTQNEELESIKAGSDYIQITTSLAQSKLTRADDSSVERTVEHIDVFVVEAEGTDAGKVVHYERNSEGNDSGAAADGSGTLTLSVKRGDAKFAADAKYAIYLVANSTITTEAAAALATLDNLNDWVQSDALLHVTGTNLGAGTPPQTFLMQAIAGSAAGQVINSSSGNGENLTLSAQFERAAAKVVVNIKQGADVEFYKQLSDGATQGSALYFFNMLPTKSYVLPTNSMAIAAQDLVTTTDLGPNTHTYIWTEAADHTAAAPKHDITLVGYAYAHDWSAAEPLNETCIIVNIPVKWNKDGDASNGKEVTACNSWYMIPLSQNEKFERNTCYVVNVTINTAGASDRTSVVELDGIEFQTLPWQEVEISVGDSGNEPKYLMLNKDVVKIYNANVDATQLTFSSSSPIVDIRLKDIDDTAFPTTYRGDGQFAYYKNKYSRIITLSNAVQSGITATADAKLLNGPITITSPIVPASQADIDQQIAQLTKPEYPNLTLPTEPAGRPTQPDVVEEPTTPVAPVAADYVPESETPSSWSQSFTEYQVVEQSGVYTFQKRTATRSWSWGSGWSDWTYSSWTVDTATQAVWDSDLADYNEAVATYNERLVAYNTYKNVTLPTYETALQTWQSSAEYQTYASDLAAYNAAMDTYNTQLKTYNDAVAALQSQVGGEETHNNTIRYLEFEVTNEQGLTADFRVEQYPLIYITNVVGWYSYRDDFIGTGQTEPTTYQNKRGAVVGISFDSYNSSTGVVSYDYHTSSDGFWRSKVNRDVDSAGNYDETQTSYDIDYYYWNNNGSGTLSHSSQNSGGNARMYHVRVTATSAKYTVGRPMIVDSNNNETSNVESGFTEASAANAQLVSPSFMIASRLGFINTGAGNITFGNNTTTLAVAREHCQNYVEVSADGEVFDDWRLPTAAEIGIILDLQGTGSGDNTKAIDYLLNASYYYSASGPVQNNNSTSSGTAIRCIRDAYEN